MLGNGVEMENGKEMPIGLSFGLAMNEKAMSGYASMSEKEKSQVLDAARNVNSKEEMERLVSGLEQNLIG